MGIPGATPARLKTRGKFSPGGGSGHGEGAVFDLSLLVLSSLLAAATPHHGGGSTHVVRKGETLWELARERSCTVEQVRKANDLRPGGLRIGMTLTLPSCKPTVAKTHVVARGDTLSAVAKRYGTTVEAIQKHNGLDSDVIRVAQRLQVAGGAAPPAIRMIKGQSVGSPQRGKLAEGARLPQSKRYYRRRLPRTYAAAHVVDQLEAAIGVVSAAHPKVGRLAIGDLSDEDGGSLSGHNSHQSGRDVDLGLYFKKQPAGYPKEFVAAAKGKLDVAAMWTLVDALYEQSKKAGGPTKIFLDYRIQKQLYTHARGQKISRAKLKKVFSYPDGRWAAGRLVQHLHNHHDHLHIRFGCPPKDTGCKGG